MELGGLRLRGYGLGGYGIRLGLVGSGKRSGGFGSERNARTPIKVYTRLGFGARVVRLGFMCHLRAFTSNECYYSLQGQGLIY